MDKIIFFILKSFKIVKGAFKKWIYLFFKISNIIFSLYIMLNIKL